MSKQISIVVPLFNEEESLPHLIDWIKKVLDTKYSYEVLLVDDGSKDQSWRIIEDLVQHNEFVRGIKFQRNYGKSAALQKGFESCNGDVVVTMDADLQDSPEEIPELYDMIVNQDFRLYARLQVLTHVNLGTT